MVSLQNFQALVTLSVLSVIAAFPQNAFIQDSAGQFAFAYSSPHGFSSTQRGYLKPLQTEAGLINVPAQEGSYAYYTPDGQLYKVRFTADENGFVPIAEHIPQPVQAIPVTLIQQ